MATENRPDARSNLVLTIDYGTQSVRALIFNKYGDLLAKNKVEFKHPYYSLESGYAEQDPMFYWENLANATKGLKEQEPELWKELIGLSITTIRDTCVCLDEKCNPLRPIILWCDQRMATKEFCVKQLPPPRIAVYKLAKMFDPGVCQMQASACNWIKEFEPNIWQNTHKFVMFSTYITYLLTGNLVDSVANQIGHIPFNSRRNAWMNPTDLNYYIWDIPKEKLVDLVFPGDILGTISKEASDFTGIPEGLKLIASGSDKGCETIGSGATTNMASISFGTAATIQMTTEKYVEPVSFMPAYPAVISGLYNPEVQVYRGYWMVTWFKKEFARKEVVLARKLNTSPEALLDHALEQVPAGCDGLVLQPYWSPTLKAPEGRGSIIGFSDVHSRAHLYRAIVEGIGFALMDGLKNMEKRSGITVKKITVNGGGSQSDVICQITADMFGVPVVRAQTYETSGLGAAITAYVGLGVYEGIKPAITNMVKYTSEFRPNHEMNKIYQRIFNDVYKKMYKQLKPLYNELRKIIGKN